MYNTDTAITSCSGGYISGAMSRQYIIKKLSPYGFIECDVMLQFLYRFCGETMARSELLFIMEKTKECLVHHDNGSSYFNELKSLCREINDELLYRISCPTTTGG